MSPPSLPTENATESDVSTPALIRLIAAASLMAKSHPTLPGPPPVESSSSRAVSGSAAMMLSSLRFSRYDATLLAPASMLRWDSTTPFGLPVLPEV